MTAKRSSAKKAEQLRLPGVATVATSHVLKADWAQFEAGPYSKLPTDQEAVMDGYLMQRYNPTVRAILTITRQLICSRLGHYSNPDNPNAEEFVALALDNLHGGLRKTVASMLSCLWAGFSVGEKLWSTESGWTITAIELLHPLTFWNRNDKTPGIVYDPATGGVSEFTQFGMKSDDAPVKLTPEQVVYWPFQQELREEVFGKRLTDAARRNWYMLSKLESYWSIFLEMFAHPTPVFQVPKGMQTDANTGEQVTNADWYAAAIQKMGPGNGIVFESGPEDAFKFDLMAASVGSDIAYQRPLEYHNEEMFKALLMSPLLLTNPTNGSRAQAGTVLGLFEDLIEAIRAELGEVLIGQVVLPMVRYNYGPEAPVGTWEFEPLNSDDLAALSSTLEALSRSKCVKFSDADEASIREKFADTGLVPLDEIPPEERAAAAEAELQNPLGFPL